MSDIVRTIFSEGRKVARDVKDSIVPINIFNNQIIPSIVFGVIILLLMAFVFRLPISGTGTKEHCVKYEERNNNLSNTPNTQRRKGSANVPRCLQYETRPYNNRWNILFYILGTFVGGAIFGMMYYKIIFSIYNPHITAASTAYRSFRF